VTGGSALYPCLAMWGKGDRPFAPREWGGGPLTLVAPSRGCLARRGKRVAEGVQVEQEHPWYFHEKSPL